MSPPVRLGSLARQHTLVAVNAAGASPPPNAVTLTFPAPCGGSPHAPTRVRAWRDESIVSLPWSPPADGPAVSHYVARVSGAYVGGFATAGRPAPERPRPAPTC